MNNDALIIIIINIIISSSSSSSSSSNSSSRIVVVIDVAFPQQQWYKKTHQCYIILRTYSTLSASLITYSNYCVNFKVRNVRLISLDELMPYLRELIL